MSRVYSRATSDLGGTRCILEYALRVRMVKSLWSRPSAEGRKNMCSERERVPVAFSMCMHLQLDRVGCLLV